MTITTNDFQVIFPELLLLSATFVTLLVGLYAPKYQKKLTYYCAQLGLILAAVATWRLRGIPDALAFSGHYRHDSVSVLLQLDTALVCVSASTPFT